MATGWGRQVWCGLPCTLQGQGQSVDGCMSHTSLCTHAHMVAVRAGWERQ